MDILFVLLPIFIAGLGCGYYLRDRYHRHRGRKSIGLRLGGQFRGLASRLIAPRPRPSAVAVKQVPTKQIISIQYLRAIAAVAVVYHHAFENHFGSELKSYAFGIWGVDIFFVISGFIMWVTTADSATSTLSFWRKRAIRVYPIYWVALSIWIVCRFFVPDKLANADLTIETTALSYFLVPHYHSVFATHVWPILIPGWTLQYELFFYMLFGLTLMIASRSQRATCIVICLSLLAVIGVIIEPETALLKTYTDSLLLEFVSGIGLGFLYLKGGRLPRQLALAVIATASVVLLIDEYLFSESWRFLALGLPAFLVVLGAVSLEQALTKRAIAPLAFLGDASYSLYLFHPIATAIVAVIWARLFGIAYPAGFICAAVVAAIAVSIFFHLFIERPITGWLSMGGSLDGLFRHKLKRRAVGERLLPQQHTTPVSRK